MKALFYSQIGNGIIAPLLVFLLFRPEGLFGERHIDRV